MTSVEKQLPLLEILSRLFFPCCVSDFSTQHYHGSVSKTEWPLCGERPKVTLVTRMQFFVCLYDLMHSTLYPRRWTI